jgi:hypothetical protein
VPSSPTTHTLHTPDKSLTLVHSSTKIFRGHVRFISPHVQSCYTSISRTPLIRSTSSLLTDRRVWEGDPCVLAAAWSGQKARSAEPHRAPQPRQRSNPSRCNAMCSATPFEAGTDTFKRTTSSRPGRSCGGTMLSHTTVARESIACAAPRRCCCLQPGWEFAQPRARFAPCSLRSAAAPTAARPCAPPPPHPTPARSHFSPGPAPSRRYLNAENGIVDHSYVSGTIPTQIGALASLKHM